MSSFILSTHGEEYVIAIIARDFTNHKEIIVWQQELLANVQTLKHFCKYLVAGTFHYKQTMKNKSLDSF